MSAVSARRVAALLPAAVVVALLAAPAGWAPNVPPPPPDSGPVWSPDGTRIAFTRPWGSAHPLYIRGGVVEVAGGPERPLLGEEVPRATVYHLSPDWSQVMFVSGPAYVWPLDGRAPRLLEPPPSDGFVAPAWSPDGRLLAYAGSGGVYLLDTAAAAPPRRVLANGSEPAWSPDGAWLAAVHNPTRELVLVSAADGAVRSLAPLTTAPRRLVWSPDGTRLAVVSRNEPLAVLALDGRTRNYSISTRFSESQRVAWTPDGSGVVYGSERPPYGLVVLDLATGQERRLTRPGARDAFEGDREPVFSPDGRRLAFVGAERCREQVGVHVVRADGSGRRRLTRECRIRGTARADVLRGRDGSSILLGLGGNDRLTANVTAYRSYGNELYGGPGDDVLVGAGGADLLDGGPGRDRIHARHPEQFGDSIRCGPGRDTVYADRRDRVARDCERVLRR